MAKSTFVYVTYIRTTPDKLWSALTDVGSAFKAKAGGRRDPRGSCCTPMAASPTPARSLRPSRHGG